MTQKDKSPLDRECTELLDYIAGLNASLKELCESHRYKALSQIYDLADHVIAGIGSEPEPKMRRTG